MATPTPRSLASHRGFGHDTPSSRERERVQPRRPVPSAWSALGQESPAGGKGSVAGCGSRRPLGRGSGISPQYPDRDASAQDSADRGRGVDLRAARRGPGTGGLRRRGRRDRRRGPRALSGPDGADLVLLDVMLPDGDGKDVLREIRSASRTPVIMVTARGEELERVLGLELGADDYVTKPFSAAELAARVRAVLRRADAPRSRRRVGARGRRRPHGARPARGHVRR